MWARPLLYIIKFRGKVLKDGMHLLRKKILWDPKQINTKFFTEYKMHLYSLNKKKKVSQQDSTCQNLIDFKRFFPQDLLLIQTFLEKSIYILYFVFMTFDCYIKFCYTFVCDPLPASTTVSTMEAGILTVTFIGVSLVPRQDYEL